MAKSRFQIENPSGVPFTLTVTMTLREWELVQKALDGVSGMNGPAIDLSVCIRQLVDKARIEFEAESLRTEGGV